MKYRLEDDDSDEEDPKFPENVRTIIATKGLPCTFKTTIARRIGDWARCPVLYIDHFLDALSIEKGFTANSRPSNEEGKRINRVAIEALWKAAERHLDKVYGSKCLVVKSNLSSSFELGLLIRLVHKFYFSIKVIVIDCQMKNEHRYRLEMNQRVSLSEHLKWCKASSWEDIVRARNADDYLLDDDHAWDQHIKDLLKGVRLLCSPFQLVRLVADAYEDISPYNDVYRATHELGYDFRDAIRYLLTDYVKDENVPYKVIELHDLQRYALKSRIEMSARHRSKYFCATNGRDNCLFKYLIDITYDDRGPFNCGVCEDRIYFSGPGSQPAYTCYFCFLTLHKSCAESRGIVDSLWDDPYAFWLSDSTLKQYPCKSCVERGDSFSDGCQSCLFQTHLKANMLPTIIRHDSHTEHYLSIQFPVNNYVCKACGELQEESGYACNICKFYCHIKCIFHDKEILHKHGGYEHVMKLKFSHDGMELEESYWCDSCYEDLDPQNWFYVCTVCPYYVVHTQCPCRIREAETRHQSTRLIRIS